VLSAALGYGICIPRQHNHGISHAGPEQAKALEFAVKWTWQRLGCGQKSLPPNLKMVISTLGDLGRNLNISHPAGPELSLNSPD